MNKDKAIASARAALGCQFDILVDMLDLDPVVDWHVWKDADGNSLRICKNKSVKIYPSTRTSNITKDIFRKALPSLIYKHSYWGMLLSDVEKTDNILILLGNDGKLRCSYFINNIWIQNFNPLLLGFGILKYIICWYLETEVRSIKSLKTLYPHDFEIEEAWSFGFPVEDNDIYERIKCLLKIQNLQE